MLARLGLPTAGLGLDRRLEADKRHLLTEGPSSLWSGSTVQTASVREYKSWIGVPDAMARRLGQTDGLGELNPEKGELQRAAYQYLFGDSELVRDWEPVIDAQLAPFSLTVFVAGRVVIPAGASLVAVGGPKVLLFEHLLLENGGRLELYCPCNVYLGTLEKRGLEA